MAYVVGSAEVELVPSAKGFDEKADALLSNLKVNVGLDPDVTGLRAQLAEITDLKVNVGIDLHDQLAKAELDVLTRDRKVDVDSGVGVGAVPGVGALPSAGATAGGLGPAVGVAIVGVAAALAALAGPLVAVAAGLTGILGPAALVAGVFALIEQHALSTDKAFSKSLQPSLNGLTKAFDGVVKANTGALLAPLTAGIQLLTSLLPLATPIIQVVSAALVQLIAPVQRAVSDGTFARWIAQIVPLIGPAFADGGRILVGVATGIGQIIGAFTANGQGQKLLDGLAGMAGDFAKIGSNKDFQQFVKWSIDHIPLLVTTTLDFAKAVIIIGQGLAVIGVPILTVINGLSDFVTAVGAGIKALFGSKAAMDGAKKASDDFNLSIGGLGRTIGDWLVNTDKAISAGVGNWGRSIGDWLVNTDRAITTWFGALPGKIGAFLVGADRWLSTGAQGIIRGLLNGLVTGFVTVVEWFRHLPGQIGNFLVGADRWLISAGSGIVSGLLKGLQDAWGRVTSFVKGAIDLIPAGVRHALGINSPSTVFMEIGDYSGQGLQIGLQRSIGTAMDTATAQLRTRASDLAASATASVSAQFDASSLTGSGSTDVLSQLLAVLQAILAKTPGAQDIASAARIQARAGVA